MELIISTYNNPRALDLCLTAVKLQTINDFKVCIADDGSGIETQDLIKAWKKKYPPGQFRHVWHEDHGFQKNKILNRAIATSEAEYLIFIDGDCLPSPQFIERHLEKSRPNTFCSGGVVRLDEKMTDLASKEFIECGEIFSKEWLKTNKGEKKIGALLKLNYIPKSVAKFLEYISPVKKTWNGGNASTWRQHLLEVNGFEEYLRYGAEDIELGYRLNNAGVKGQHIRYTAPLLHLEHTRSYADHEVARQNKLIAKASKKSKKTKSKNGIFENHDKANPADQ